MGRASHLTFGTTVETLVGKAVLRIEFENASRHRMVAPSEKSAVASFFIARQNAKLRCMADVTIEIIKNGPYIVKGEVELKDADGNSYPVEKRMALCRCGASSEKPFCDGTHSKIGFQAAEKAVPESAEG